MESKKPPPSKSHVAPNPTKNTRFPHPRYTLATPQTQFHENGSRRKKTLLKNAGHFSEKNREKLIFLPQKKSAILKKLENQKFDRTIPR